MLTLVGVAAALEARAQPSEEPSEAEWGQDSQPDEEWGEEGDAAGFAAVSQEERLPSSVPEATATWHTKGFVRSHWGMWVERLTRAKGPGLAGGNQNPFGKGRQSLDLETRYSGEGLRAVASLHAEYDVAYWVEREAYDQATLDAYNSLLYLGETYISHALGPLQLSVGRQIVAWGQGEAISLVDVVNPRDLREPGLADLDDLRLPVLATRAGLFFGYHRLEAMVIHEAFFGYRTPPNGPFSALPSLLRTNPAAALLLTNDFELWFEDNPKRFGLDTQQWLLRWSYEGPCLDASLYFASVLDQQVLLDGFRLESTQVGAFGSSTLAPPMRALVIELTHPRYTMVGYAGALPLGNFVFKWEAYAALGRRYNAAPQPGGLVPAFRLLKTDEVGGVWGLSYAGISDTQLVFELGKRWLGNKLDGLVFPVHEPTWALRATHATLREDLVLSFAISGFGWTADYGWLARAEATYTLRDGLKLGTGGISYQPSDRFGFLAGLTKHDRVFLKLRYDFTLD